MKRFEKLIIEAQIITEPKAEAGRVMQVCNACRCCEGFCAVFPAMTQRLEFGKADISYPANLCHNCGACLHACQYAPSHEFAINVPKAMAEARLEAYQHYAQSAAFGALYRCAGATVTLALVFGLILFLLLAIGSKGSLFHPPLVGDSYQIFPHNLLARMSGLVSVLAIDLLMTGVIHFWHKISPGMPRSAETAEASHNALTLKYLDGGYGKGCNEAGNAFILMRRRFHHFTFYDFLLCFVATVAVTGYHYFAGIGAPYPFFGAPAMLGTLGGIGLVVGPVDLLWPNLECSPLHGDTWQKPMGRGFTLLLLLASLIGLALLTGRDTSWMAILLAIHLSVVMAPFLTIPYGKSAHGLYRCAALLKWAIEKRRGKQAGISGD